MACGYSRLQLEGSGARSMPAPYRHIPHDEREGRAKATYGLPAKQAVRRDQRMSRCRRLFQCGFGYHSTGFLIAAVT